MKIFTFDEACRPAMASVTARLRERPQWQAELRCGKTLGVLLYEGGFLAAFSGTLGGQTRQEGFVPPVFDLMQPGSWFLEEEAAISAINARLDVLGHPASEATEEECRLRCERKQRSRALQDWLFRQYRFLNARGEERALPDLVPLNLCQSGMGDCCAPKLLQEAYRRGLTPLAVAEWDAATGEFSPPCAGRCRPVLQFMLQGLDDVEPDPRLAESVRLIPLLRTVYEDECMLVVDKPSGLLSVPGKEFLPSVESVTGHTAVHRLDRDTSGLLLLAKNPADLSRLRSLFEGRRVEKHYVALLEREMPVGTECDIALPLCLDIFHRPRQTVSERYGKKALTHCRVVGNVNGHASVQLTPHTGRTHQLRVHCAHPEGLDNPILGDPLYGSSSGAASSPRLMLHACVLNIDGRRFFSPCLWA
jgi:tRNA pseudouridine32 synthase/23S rRNA pseudouridine746 synthase